MMSSLWLRALHALGHASRRSAARDFDKAARNVGAAQRETLGNILSHLADTELGRARGYATITSHEALQQLPIWQHAEFQPFIAREMGGERRVLVPEKPEYYAMTTGTTANARDGAKHVPITDAYRREFQRTVAIAMRHMRNRYPPAFTGRVLYFVGSASLGVTGDGTPIGTMSGYNFVRLPKLLQAVYAWPAELFRVSDTQARNWLSLHLAAIGDVTAVAGIYPASIVYLLRTFEEILLPLADAVEHGVIPPDLQVEPALRQAITGMMRPRPDVARRLREAAKLPRGARVAHVFPRLALVYCWKTATAGAFVEELCSHLGPTIAVRDAIYAACEAWLSIPIGEEESGGPLAVTSHYFEFVEESAWERGERRTITADAVKDGARYVVITTASNGLVRYALNDIVEVCGRYGTIPRIRFVRKLGAATNLVGEKLIEEHITLAVTDALRDTKLAATWFCAVPMLPSTAGMRPRYDLWIEPDQVVDDAAWGQLQERFTARLGERAVEIPRLLRANHLDPCRVVPVPLGSYERFRRRRIAEGCADSQLKVQNLVEDIERVPLEIRTAG